MPSMSMGAPPMGGGMPGGGMPAPTHQTYGGPAPSVRFPPPSLLYRSANPSPPLPQYESIVTQTPAFNTTIYVGNLVPYTTQADLIPLFQGFGYIVEIRMQADRGFAFVKLDTHENAALAIVQLTGTQVHGRQLKCSWGKDRLGGEGAAPPPQQQQYTMVRFSSFYDMGSFKTERDKGRD